MSVSRSLEKRQLYQQGFFPWFARITPITYANDCSNASTYVVFLVPPTRTIHAIRHVLNDAKNAALTTSVKSHAGSLARLVWNRASGLVLTNLALWYAAQ
jgi:hypothetical protein